VAVLLGGSVVASLARPAVATRAPLG
jgi:hypothetical protein